MDELVILALVLGVVGYLILSDDIEQEMQEQEIPVKEDENERRK